MQVYLTLWEENPNENVCSFPPLSFESCMCNLPPDKQTKATDISQDVSVVIVYYYFYYFTKVAVCNTRHNIEPLFNICIACFCCGSSMQVEVAENLSGCAISSGIFG